MRKLTFLAAAFTISYIALSQKNKKADRQLYLTQIKAAEALLRLNETGEAKKQLSETNACLRNSRVYFIQSAYQMMENYR